MLWAMGLGGIFLFAKARMMPVGGLCNCNAQPLRVVQCRAKYIRFSDSARSSMVSIVSINAFSVGTTGEVPLRPPPAVVTISDAITTAINLVSMASTAKKPIEMPQKSRTARWNMKKNYALPSKISSNLNMRLEGLWKSLSPLALRMASSRCSLRNPFCVSV